MPLKFVFESDEELPSSKDKSLKSEKSAKDKTSKDKTSKDKTSKDKSSKDKSSNGKKSEKPAKKGSKSDKHICEHIIKSKDGERKCTSNALREVGGHWYCGTEKSGHYKSHFNGGGKASVSKKKTISDADKIVKNKVLRKFQEENSFFVKKHKIDGVPYLLELSRSILFEPKTERIVGVFDNGEIRKLNKRECEFVEGHRRTVDDEVCEPFSDSEDDKSDEEEEDVSLADSGSCSEDEESDE